jgi:hypothetical protein
VALESDSDVAGGAVAVLGDDQVGLTGAVADVQALTSDARRARLPGMKPFPYRTLAGDNISRLSAFAAE